MTQYTTDISSPLFAVNKTEEIFQKRVRIERMRTQMEIQRSSFISQWKENNDFVAPRRGRFFVDDVNKGDRRNQRIIDTSPVMAVRTLVSGMVAGITSPSRPWFRLSLPGLDESFGEQDRESKEWLHMVTNIMMETFARSNLYRVLPVVYKDMIVFGTGCMFVDHDMEDSVRFYSNPIGSYTIAQDDKLKVNAYIREFQMTCNQIVERFGRDPNDPSKIDWSNISDTVKSLYGSANGETYITVIHAIIPNWKYRPNSLDAKHKKFASIYYELGRYGGNVGGSHNQNVTTDRYKILRESGYDLFPVLAPRWEVTGEDVYGTDCPTLVAIGDIKQLMTGEKRSLQAIEKQVIPDLKAPASVKGQGKANQQNANITYIPDNVNPSALGPLYEVNFDINALELKQQQVRARIDRAYFVDIILSLSQTDRRQITAREVEERSAEKLLVLGPVLEQLNQDLLNPLIDITFARLLEAGKIPPPPPSLEGKDLKVEYISVMAQAQKLIAAGSVEQFTNYAGGLAQFKPTVLDRINEDALLKTYAEITSVDPDSILSDEAVEQERNARAEMQAQEQAVQDDNTDAQTLKTLSEVREDEAEALTQGAL